MIYLMLDEKDITHVIGEVSSDQLMQELHFKSYSTLDSWISRNNKYKGCWLVEKYDEDHRKRKKVDSQLIYEKKGRKYYINTNCRIYVIYKSGRKKYLSIFQKPGHPKSKYYCKVSDHDVDVVRTLALCFLGMKKEQCCILEGELDLKNIKVMSKSECSSKTGRMARANKPVGLYENGKLKRKYDSAREAAKHLYMSYQTVSDYCNKKVKKPMMDLRWV